MIATMLLVGGIIAALTRQIAWFAVVVAVALLSVAMIVFHNFVFKKSELKWEIPIYTTPSL
jgi:hypothetical protein